MPFTNSENKSAKILFLLSLVGAMMLTFTLFKFDIVAVAHAEEEKKTEGEKKGEGEKKAEGGEGEKAGEGSDREWAKRTTRLNVLEAKIKETKESIVQMIRAKKNNLPMVDEKGVKIDVVKKIGETFKELNKVTGEYNKAKDELHFRFPEEGALINRKYVPERVQTLEQIERESGLTGDLDRTKEAIDKKYEPFIGEKKVVPEKRAGAPESTLKTIKKNDEAPETSSRIKLSQ